MQIRVLGPPRIHADGRTTTIGSPSQRIVLACLVAAHGRLVPTHRLIGAVWGDEPPRTAESTLRTYVSRLRRLVGDRIEAGPGGYALIAGVDEVDAWAFGAALSSSRPGPSRHQLEEALSWWSGPPLGDVDDHPHLRGWARRLEEQRTDALSRLAAAALAEGDTSAAVLVAEDVVEIAPLHEGAWATLVSALVTARRPGDALRAYQRAADALAEAGLTPSANLREAERAALIGGVDEPGPAAPSRSTSSPAPAPPSPPLVGRDVDLVALDDLLAQHRIVTVHGPGGIGKSSLALAMASRAHQRFRLGARVVHLARIAEAADVPAAIVDVCGPAPSDETGAALAHIGDLDVLVVLDSCEHVLEPVAEAAAAILGGGDRARILTTSRQRLGVDGEHTWPVSTLPTDGPDAAAVELFVQRARQHDPSLTFDAAARAAVERIVDRLDGMPLAIEMAAARAPSLALADLHAVLAERFDILRAGPGSEPRHRTMRAVIEWSESLLDPEDRAVLHDLSVFAGPVLARDVTGVLGGADVLVRVADLADRSLVVTGHNADPPTYGLLDVVRHHGRERTVETGHADVLARRHASHFVDLARALDWDLRGPGEADAAASLGASVAEFRAAHQHALVHQPHAAVALTASLHYFACSRQRVELLEWARGVEPHATRGPDAAVAVCSLGYRANDRGRFEDGLTLGRRALELAGDDPARRFAAEVLGDASCYAGDLDEGVRWGRVFFDECVRADDRALLGTACGSVALPLAYGDDVDAALEFVDQCRSLDLSPSGRAWMTYTTGEVLLERDPVTARRELADAIRLADEAGNRFLASVARASHASLLGRIGEPAGALAAYAETVDHLVACGDRTHLMTTLRNLAEFLTRVGEHRAAAELLASVRASSGSAIYGEEAARLALVDAEISERIGPAPPSILQAAGRPPDEVAISVLAEARLRLT